MANLKIPTSYDPKAILIADDEPEHVEWLADYFKAKGFKVTLVTNVRDAITAAEGKRFRAHIIDLNIPLGGWLDSTSIANSTYAGYQGLHIIRAIETQANNGRRVIAYSAHSNDQIIGEIRKLYCGYVVKGRARELKDAVEALLSHDPYAGRT